MLSFNLSLKAVFLIALGIQCAIAQTSASTKISEAEKVWEQSITAKGGRVRLNAVSNILESSTSSSVTVSGLDYKRKGVALILIPNKVWSFIDDRPEVFGRTATMLDYENMTEYFWADGRTDVAARPIPDGFARKVKAYQNSAIIFLMEAKGLKPKVIDMTSASLDGVPSFVVNTRIDGRQVDFVISKTIYLPVKVMFHDFGTNGEARVTTIRLDNYVEIEGIKIPLRTKYNDQSWETSTIRFNVDYDLSIFLRAPNKTGPDAWRKD